MPRPKPVEFQLFRVKMPTNHSTVCKATKGVRGPILSVPHTLVGLVSIRFGEIVQEPMWGKFDWRDACFTLNIYCGLWKQRCGVNPMRIFIISFLVLVSALLSYLLFLQGFSLLPVSTQHPLYERLIVYTKGTKPALAKAYRSGGMDRLQRLYLRWAIAKFPDLASCKAADDSYLDWARIKTEAQLELCIFYLTQDKGREDYKNWLDQTGLKYQEQDKFAFNPEGVRTYQGTDVTVGLIAKFQPGTRLEDLSAPFMFWTWLFEDVSFAEMSVNFDELNQPNSIQVRTYSQM
ncbi:MAG: hypothetical protein AAFN43_04450 [Pseudomonadota bacterium]